MAKVRSLRKDAAEKNGPGSPVARFHYLMNELEKRFPNPHPFGPGLPEAQYLDQIDQTLAMKNDAIDTAIVALNDWLHVYAPEFCDEKRVVEAQNRLQEGGTLYYIATVLQKCRPALKG